MQVDKENQVPRSAISAKPRQALAPRQINITPDQPTILASSLKKPSKLPLSKSPVSANKLQSKKTSKMNSLNISSEKTIIYFLCCLSFIFRN